jgi:acyl-CoA thioester hydrolase/thioesterase-3
MSMQEFINAGYGWYIKAAHLEFKRALGMGERFIVRTWVDGMRRSEVTVKFEIVRKSNGKLCCDGQFDYTMIDLKNGRAAVIPDWIAQKYAI